MWVPKIRLLFLVGKSLFTVASNPSSTNDCLTLEDTVLVLTYRKLQRFLDYEFGLASPCLTSRILRNALIAFQKRSHPQAYWSEIFTHTPQFLPPEWTYGKQIQKAPESRIHEAVAVRDFSSKDPFKRERMRSAYEHIQKTSEKVLEKHILSCPLSVLQNEFMHPGETISDILPPERCLFYLVGETAKLVFFTEREKPINTYVAKKAFREKRKLL